MRIFYKDPIYFLTFMLAFLSQALKATASSTLPTDFIAYYPLDGDYLDYSGNANHATLSGSQQFSSDRFGRGGSSAYFDGSTYAWGSSSSFSAADKTIIFWFKPSSLQRSDGAGMSPFSYGGNGCGTSIVFFFNNPNKASLGKSIYEAQAHCDINQIFYSNAPSPVGEWHQWAYSTSSEGSKLYVDGILVSTTSKYVTNTYVANKYFTLGGQVGPSGSIPYTGWPNRYLVGGLDELIIFSRALTSLEIYEIYDNEPPALSNNLFVLYEGDSTQITSAMLYSTDEQTDLTYTISNVDNGYFLIDNAGLPITEFTQQQVLNGRVYFKSTNSETPSFDIVVSDGLLWTASVSGNVVANPTNQPTERPVPHPTTSPSLLSTVQPTFRPTVRPTSEPTHVPTHIPTHSPTLEPTKEPTHTPTRIPTHLPTVEGTQAVDDYFVDDDSTDDDAHANSGSASNITIAALAALLGAVGSLAVSRCACSFFNQSGSNHNADVEMGSRHHFVGTRK